jgi:hypothetical protein
VAQQINGLQAAQVVAVTAVVSTTTQLQQQAKQTPEAVVAVDKTVPVEQAVLVL